jgi:hypothetical protein
VLAVKQVGGNDLEIVVGGLGKRAPAIAIAERPDARHIRSKEIVDRDVAPRIDRDTGLVETEIVGVGTASDREQNIRADDLRIAFGALDRQATFCYAVRG